MDPTVGSIIIVSFVETAYLAHRGLKNAFPSDSVPFEMSEDTKAATRARIDETRNTELFIKGLERRALRK